MKKNVYFIIMLAMAGLWLVTILMRKHAERARAVSDKILQDFKTVDGSLQNSNDSLLTQNDSTLIFLKQLQDTDSNKLP